MGSPYLQNVQDAATSAGIDPDLAQRWVTQESGFNPTAVSSKGAVGLTQLMPDTAKELGVDPYDPQQNIRGGVKYLRNMMDKYGGNAPLAFAAYNAGPGRVDDFVNKGRELPPETVNYVKSITGHSINDTPTMTKAMASQGSQGTPMPAPTPTNTDTPSLGSRVLAGGPGALFGAPNGVFPDAQGNAGGGYDMGLALQRAGAGLTSIANPAGGAAMMNAANMPIFKQNFGVVNDAFGNQYVLNHKTGQVSRPGQAPGAPGADAPGPVDASTALAQSPKALMARAEQEQKKSSDTINALRQGAVSAAMLRDKANEGLKLLDDPDLKLGGGASTIANLESYLPESMQPNSVSKTQLFQKIAAQLQGQYLAGQKGVRFAGPELKFSSMANPDTSKSHDTNRQILNDYIRQADLSIQASKLANDHMNTYGVLGPQFNTDLSKLYAPGASSQLDNSPQTQNRPPLDSFFKK